MIELSYPVDSYDESGEKISLSLAAHIVDSEYDAEVDYRSDRNEIL